MASAAPIGMSRTQESEAPFWSWFGNFLVEELSPYPGRLSLVLRMVVAATITMVLIMTFRLPGAGISAYYTLVLSRDSPQTTLRSALGVMAAFLGCATFCMLGLILFVDEPLTHFLFVVGSLFVSFFLIRVATDYSAAAAFSFSLAIVLPLWDATTVPTGSLVTATLWAATSVSVGLAATVAVEYAFNLYDPRDPLREGIEDRLAVVSEVLSQCCGKEVDRHTRRRIERYGTVGVSRLRRLASRPLAATEGFIARATVVSLVGRLVDLSNAVLHLPPPTEQDTRRLQRIGHRLDAIRKLFGRGFRLEHFASASHAEDATFPLLPEIERTVQLLTIALTDTTPEEVEPGAAAETRPGILLPDAFSNSSYVQFALRGCLAASLCYVLMNAVAWHGLATSLATCIVTATSTIGSSRQKQMLRLAGVIAGGVIFGIGAQVLVLPMLDGIGGFTILFVAATLPAAWIATASARLSYLGLQMALAFYLIHLQEFYPQTDLSIGRDRVMGVLLGLVAMWLVFDQLGSRPAAEAMVETFRRNVRLLAELADPWRAGREALNRHQIAQLRERIFANFAEVNAQADAVLLEVGVQRAEHLAWRSRVRSIQPSLRTLYVIQVALLQYRLDWDPSQVAADLLAAQRAFDGAVRDRLTVLSNTFLSDPPPPSGELRRRFRELEDSIRIHYPAPPPRIRAILSLSSHLVEVLEG